MNISGVLVFAKTDKHAAIGVGLSALPGVEWHASTQSGRMIVTVEGETPEQVMDIIVRIHNLPHVLTVSPIYNHFDTQGTADAEVQAHYRGQTTSV